ncbi:Rho GTPase-activating protein 20 [Myotis brandtii]|uniref:Rho GTPase-activating protein 20 n=1 Tax=Myotis brandtii TaxID=109478 RepID=S7PKU8_MYOBR|nr:Rho GTPase-activating protein 20 [Myotis brandtii]
MVKSLGQGSRSVDSLFALRDHDPDQPEWVVFTLSDFDLGLSERADIQMERPPEPRRLPSQPCTGGHLQEHLGHLAPPHPAP